MTGSVFLLLICFVYSILADRFSLPITKTERTVPVIDSLYSNRYGGSSQKLLISNSKASSGGPINHGFPVKEFNYFAYTANISLGSPPQSISAIIDTNWADLFVPASDCVSAVPGYCSPGNATYNSSASSTFYDNGTISRVMYSNTDGFARLAEDTLTLADGLQVPGQAFHDIKYYRSVQDQRWGGLFDGVLGLAIDGFWFPGSIEGPNILPSPFRSMIDNDLLHANMFSIVWPNETQEEGSLVFGDFDEELLDGDLTPLPLFPEGTTKWQIEIESVTIIGDNDNSGKRVLLHELLPGYAAITMSTMPFILFHYKIAENLLRQLVKWSPSRCGTFVVVDCDVVPSLPDIIIGLRGQNVTLRGEDYVEKRAYPMWFCDDEHRTRDGCVVMIDGFGYPDELANTVVLGIPFLKHFMGVWNWDDKTISFGQLKE